MEFFDAERDFFRCAVCGEQKNMDSYIAPRGIHCGEKICKNCYEEAFAKQYGTDRIAYVPTKVGNMQTDISDPNEHSEPRLSDVIKVLYELNDSVRDLCALLKARL